MIILYRNMITSYITMSTLSVPLSEEMQKGIESLVKRGLASNKAEAVRQAIKMYLEEQAVQDVRKAMNEPDLEGDLDALAKKL
ncbi:hypothetical protein A2344_03330 [Candidatus Peregrinibacteria bacterium RIFOXYB12_FULL_41_12]|nr:MAG: hypothetical protein A2344_03330 [Candidatus Peregrinibacteria bacterium RIFOXYB12_FULL_41_12]OGJ52597.1 MAG: hypothetical protein A2448_02460 [Candidatus Peregrinibacteria bacterium RIFOXYC2_FULL_41_22]